MKESYISEMRAFNRWYTALIGVLNRKWMDGDLTLPETRVLQAIHMQEGITAGDNVALVHINKNYVSKKIILVEKHKDLTEEMAVWAGGRNMDYFSEIGWEDMVYE